MKGNELFENSFEDYEKLNMTDQRIYDIVYDIIKLKRLKLLE
jgi:hypothetical protein